MNKRQAMKLAHRAAYRLLQAAIDNADAEHFFEEAAESETDAREACVCFDNLVQRHFEKAEYEPRNKDSK